MENNPKYTLEYYIQREEEKKNRMRNYFLIKKYGINLEEYENIFKQQKEVCAICGGKNKSSRKLAIDHCHETRKIRGLLCASCNLGVGFFKNKKELLLNAIKYLES